MSNSSARARPMRVLLQNKTLSDHRCNAINRETTRSIRDTRSKAQRTHKQSFSTHASVSYCFARACKHACEQQQEHTREQIDTDAYKLLSIARSRRRCRNVALMPENTNSHTILLLHLTAPQTNWLLKRWSGKPHTIKIPPRHINAKMLRVQA